MSTTEDIRQELYAEFQSLEETSKRVSQVVEKYKAFEVESTKKVLDKMKQRAENVRDLFSDNKDLLEADAEVKKKYKQVNQCLQRAIADLAYCKKLGKKYQGSKKIKEICREILLLVAFDFVVINTSRPDLNRNTDTFRSSPVPSQPNSVTLTSKYEINFNSLAVGSEIGVGANGMMIQFWIPGDNLLIRRKGL